MNARDFDRSKEPWRGSVGDYLANERTFLAWVRTSIGIMAFGFVVVKFTLFIKQISLVLQKPIAVREHGYSSIIGIFLVGFGALLGLMAFLRYRVTTRQLKDSSFIPSTWLTTVVTISILVVGIFLVVYLVHSVKD